MPTKYAEWVTQTCGCRWLIDIGTVVDKDEKPDCRQHDELACTVCGDTATRSTVSHGRLGGGFHTPVFD